MGVEIRVENLTKRFGSQTIWEDVSLTLPAGEISVMLGPSGTGKSVFLKCLIGLLKPENGSITIEGKDITRIPERELYEIRKLFGVLFQDGALFGSQNLFDNIAFPLREHTKKKESEIKKIVLEKMEMTGLTGAERKLPGEISGGMRKRAGLARALVLDPEILLFDEPDSGLDPVRTAYLNQLIVDLNAEIKATFLIVTHDIATARSVPDNIGLLYRRHLAMFGPREMLLSSNEPVVRQFLNGQRQGPIGMAEEKDAGELAAEAAGGGELGKLPPIPAQLPTSDGRTRETQRPPGSWLQEHGVVPPPGSFADLDLDLPTAKGSERTGWEGATPPGGVDRGATVNTEAIDEEVQADEQAAGQGGGSRRRGGAPTTKALRSRVDGQQDGVDEPASSSDEEPARARRRAPARAGAARPAAPAAERPRSGAAARRPGAAVLEDEAPARPASRASSGSGRRRSS